MKDLKMKYKHIIFISLMVTLFNFFIESTSIFGLISLFMFFFYILGWMNYIIYTLTKKDTKKVEKIIAEVYFTLMFVSSLALFIALLVPFSYGEIVNNILYLIISPFMGMRFLIRPMFIWHIVTCILTFLCVFIIRKMTKD